MSYQIELLRANKRNSSTIVRRKKLISFLYLNRNKKSFSLRLFAYSVMRTIYYKLKIRVKIYSSFCSDSEQKKLKFLLEVLIICTPGIAQTERNRSLNIGFQAKSMSYSAAG